MSKLILLAIVCLLTGSISQPSFARRITQVDSYDVAQPGNLGLGVALGTIVSVTGKYWLSNRAAVDFGVGVVGSPWTAMYADYLWHIPKVFGRGTQFGRESSLYFGGGGGVGFWRADGDCGHWSCGTASSGTGIFIRGLAGVEWYPSRTRFGVFGELGPSIIVVPGMWGAVDIDIGGRYYF